MHYNTKNALDSANRFDVDQIERVNAALSIFPKSTKSLFLIER